MSESIGVLYDINKPEEYVPQHDTVIEFLDVTQGDSLENLRQAASVCSTLCFGYFLSNARY